jgi:hypothetical protein
MTLAPGRRFFLRRPNVVVAVDAGVEVCVENQWEVGLPVGNRRLFDGAIDGVADENGICQGLARFQFGLVTIL